MSRIKATIFFISTFILIGLISMLSGGLASLLTGIWILCYALWLNRKTRHIRTNGISVKGYIKDHEKNGDGDLIAIYEFITQSGDTIKGRGFTIGYGGENAEVIDLLYDPDHPHEFIVEKQSSHLLIKVIIAAAVLFFFTMGCLILSGIIRGSR